MLLFGIGMYIPSWKLKGDWLDVCNCNIPCPCTMDQTPRYGGLTYELLYNGHIMSLQVAPSLTNTTVGT